MKNVGRSKKNVLCAAMVEGKGFREIAERRTHLCDILGHDYPMAVRHNQALPNRR